MTFKEKKKKKKKEEAKQEDCKASAESSRRARSERLARRSEQRGRRDVTPLKPPLSIKATVRKKTQEQKDAQEEPTRGAEATPAAKDAEAASAARDADTAQGHEGGGAGGGGGDGPRSVRAVQEPETATAGAEPEAQDTERRVVERWRITTDAFGAMCGGVLLVTKRSELYRVEGEPSWMKSDYESGERFRSSAIAQYALRDGTVLDGNQPPSDHATIVSVRTLSGSIYYLDRTRHGVPGRN